MRLTHLGAEGLAPYDLIIVGTSFAALPVAVTLASRARILLIDGGDVLERDDATAQTQTDDYGHFSDGYWAGHWIRAVGGTSRRWSGVVAALEEEDLQAGRGRPGWPITRAELADPYTRAAAWLGRPRAVCTPARPFGDTLLAAPLSHDTPRRLPDLALDLARGPQVDLLVGHTLVRLVSADRRFVEGLVLCGRTGAPRLWPLTAGQLTVLACGGLGNAQVLLQPLPDCGVPVGNESEQVGRYLMEHPHVASADVLVRTDRLPPPPAGFGPGIAAFRLSAATMTRHDLLACSLAVQGPMPAAADGLEVQRYFERAFGGALAWAALFARTEQEPAATNAVEVLADRTAAGSHRLLTRCVFSARDLRSIEVSTRLAGEALVRARVGVVRLHNRRIYRETTGGGHTMGTTRMGATPGDSVCDASLRVHGYGNLYVAGSSVFPSVGAANPTLTIAALSFRLADHLRTRLRAA